MKFRSSSLFIGKAQSDSYPLQYRLQMTEELLFIKKVLRFLEDLSSYFFGAGHQLLKFKKKSRHLNYFYKAF